MNGGEAPGRLMEARRVTGDRRSIDAAADFTYTVVLETTVPAADKAGGERRTAARQRTRLRSGKIVDGSGRFVTDCLLRDRSARGGRLTLPPNTTLPAAIQLYDDQTGELLRIRVRWQRGQEIGVAFEAGRTDPAGRATADQLRRRFYAVGS